MYIIIIIIIVIIISVVHPLFSNVIPPDVSGDSKEERGVDPDACKILLTSPGKTEEGRKAWVEGTTDSTSPSYH